MSGILRFFLNAGQNLNPPTAGQWSNDGSSQDFLARFSTSIKIARELQDTHLAHSVPSMFARPILFSQALGDKGHPLHKTVVDEWRGLLAIFALQNVEGLAIETPQYDVPTLEDAKNYADVKIATALRNQLPEPVADWERWWMIYCNGSLVGATSPWTMFYTPSEYRCPERIPWQTGSGLLMDPIKFYAAGKLKKPSDALTVLRRWVDLILKKSLWGLGQTHLQDKAGAVKTELELWSKELADYEDAAVRVEALDGRPKISVGAPPYLSNFSQAPDYTPTGIPESDLLLDVREGAPATLVLSCTGKIEPSDRVYGQVFASQVDFSKLKSRGDSFEAKTGAVVTHRYVIAEDVFFPPKLMKIPLSERALQLGNAEYALPLTPEFLRLVSIDKLYQDKPVLSAKTADKAVIARLDIPLANGGSLTVEKKYDVASDVTECPKPFPAFAVWPDFEAADWKDYRVAFASIQPQPAVCPMQQDGKELAKTTSGPKSLRIWESEEPIVGFALFHNSIPHGLILIQRNGQLPTPDSNARWRFAVDFGTSSTIVMADRGGGEHSLLDFQGRTVLLTQGAAALEFEIVNGLYPQDPFKAPFVTLLAQNKAMLLTSKTGTAAYSPRFDFFPGSADVYLPDVKWSGGGSVGDLPLQDYLRGIVRLAVAEARFSGIRSLQFEWARPRSLPAGPTSAMEQFWEGIRVDYAKGGGTTVTVSKGITESDAVSRCFAAQPRAHVPVLASGLSIVLDVGGGSADIGYWTRNRLVEQVSIKLAGNDLLPRFWELAHLIPTIYGICTNNSWEDEFKKKYEPPKSAIFVNSTLSESPGDPSRPSSHPIVAGLFKSLPVGEPPWVNVRSLFFLYFTGLSFFLGLQARTLMSQCESKEVHIYFGGRGSSLLAWVGNSSKVSEWLEYFFRQGFERDATENRDAKISIGGPALGGDSPIPPKQEVVRGLLANLQGWEGPADDSGARTAIPCETGWKLKSGGSASWDQKLTAQELQDLTPPANHESSFVAHFMNLIDDEVVTELFLDKGLPTLWTRKGAFSNRVEQHLKAGLKEGAVLQPVFTCELAALMDQYVEEVLAHDSVAAAVSSQ
jgi:hypothetical protein